MIGVLDTVVRCLSEGEIIGYPTEGVWGLGCDPSNQLAVTRLLKLKKRSQDKGLILVGSKISHFEQYAEVEKYKESCEEKWPGPHTWIFPTNTTPKWITGGKQSVALRLSKHKTIIRICEAFSGAIVSTSANIEGGLPAKTIDEVKEIFPDILLVKGQIGGLKSSTPIQDVVSKKWLRN